MKKILSVSFLVLLSFLLHAESTINNYDVDIRIDTDAKITVTETINITSDGTQIQHGIYRDIPTEYETSHGYNYNIGFELLSVRRDDEPEAYYTKAMSNGYRIYIGNSKAYLPSGNYTYQIVYSANRALGFFPTHDELYWNVTGNAWTFPILNATVMVYLPRTAKINQVSAYTGLMHSRDRNYQVQYPAANEAYFSTTKALPPRNGLTIVVGWPKGIILEPNLKSGFRAYIAGNQTQAIAFIGYFIVLLFYLFSWFYLGRDPKNKAIITLYEPPLGYSPQALAYIKNMEFDNKLFTAAVINMAVKKYLTITQLGDKKYKLRKISDDNSLLTLPEQAISAKLFASSPEITLESDNHEIISSAIEKFESELEKEYSSQYFIPNTLVIALGAILSLASCLPNLLTQLRAAPHWILIATTEYFCFRYIFGSNPKIRDYILGFINLILIILLIVVTIFLPRFYDVLYINFAVIVLTITLFAVTNALFFYLMRKPTRLGGEIITKTLGFEMFLKATEEEQLNFRNPPEKTPQLFELYLPFALALGLEQAWSKQFSKVLIQSQYRPTWYMGVSGGYAAFSTNEFSQSVGSSFNQAITSASAAPATTSGFGGGGGSGGGGGGGGGGGW